MANLSSEQQEMRDSLRKSAMIWGGILGVILALLLVWILSGQGAGVRYGVSAVAGLAAAFCIFKWRFSANSDAAKCESCGASYSISRTDRQEEVTGTEAKEETEEQEDGSTKKTTWTEETVAVSETYTCSSCQNQTTKDFTTTRRKDEKEEIIPKPASAKAMDQKLERAAKSGGMSRPKAEPEAAEKPKTGKGRRSR